MLTFAQLKTQPELLTPDARSPIIHENGTMTVLWEGDPGQEDVLCQAEWWEKPQPLEHIPGTNIWGGDFPAPDLPRTVCAAVGVGNDYGLLLSPRHNRYLLGPDVPAPLTPEGAPSTLAEDVVLPAPGLAGDARRVRIYLPPGYEAGQPYHTLYLNDGQVELDSGKRFPAAADTLQLALGRPDLFSGGAFFSPWHRTGLDAVLRLADAWPGGGRFAISHGDCGLGERKNLPGTQALVEETELRVWPTRCATTLRARSSSSSFLSHPATGTACWPRKHREDGLYGR